MIDEAFYSAKSKNRAARSVFLGLLGTSMLFALAAIITPKFSGIVWFFALVSITATIYVYNRYVGAEYGYTLSNDCGSRLLIIDMRIGKTVRTMARLELHSLTEVRRMTGKEYRSYKCEKGVMKYPYFPTMRPDEVYLVSFRSDYESIDVFIEADENFILALEPYTQQ
jgi:hypothetical protein